MRTERSVPQSVTAFEGLAPAQRSRVARLVQETGCSIADAIAAVQAVDSSASTSAERNSARRLLGVKPSPDTQHGTT